MNRIKAITMATAVTVALTGCGAAKEATPPVHHPHHRVAHTRTSSSAPPPSYTPPSTNVPVNSTPPSTSSTPAPTSKGSKFPTIIQLAMQHVPTSLKPYAVAPTLVPWPSNGSQVMYYNPIVTAEAGMSGYRVTLTSPPHPVAEYATTLWSSVAAADGAVTGLLATSALTYPGPGAEVSIGSGIDAATGRAHNMNILGWREGQWTLVVGEQHQLPMGTASEVAAYLHTHYLPAPAPVGSGQGLILVTVLPTGTHVTVAWQENRISYLIATYPATAHPVMTALQMVVTLKKFA